MLLTSMFALIAMDMEAQARRPQPGPPRTEAVPYPPAPPISTVYVPQPPVRVGPPPLPAPPRYPTPPPPPPPPLGPPPTPARIIAGSITDADYPAAAIRAEASGTTRVRLGITAEGKVDSCEVVGSSGNSSLDSTTCQLFTTRFRFSPASRAGVPVPSTYSGSVRWDLPHDDGPTPIGFAQGRLTQTVTLSPRGVAECQVNLIGTTFAAFDGVCRDLEFVSLADPSEMGAGHPPVRLTYTASLLPQGESLTMPALPGAPYWEETADLEIAPDGSVTACTEISRTGAPPDYTAPPFRPLCAALRGGAAFPAAAGTEVRRARMRSALYVEVQSQGR